MVDLIVLHSTASSRTSTAKGVASWMNGQPNPISYHYLVDRNGDILRMADPKFTAYHAGVSAYPKRPVGRESVNRRSIGISFVNDNLTELLTNEQLESGDWLCRVWMGKLGVGPEAVVGHKEVSPGRKTDPKMLNMDRWRAQLGCP